MTSNEVQNKKCDVCEQDLVTPSGMELIGIKISIVVDEEVDETIKEWIEKQIMPYTLGRVYRACFACWLRSIGIKPD